MHIGDATGERGAFAVNVIPVAWDCDPVAQSSSYVFVCCDLDLMLALVINGSACSCV